MRSYEGRYQKPDVVQNLNAIKPRTAARVITGFQESNMEQDILSGGVSFFHTMVGGKHQYIVQNVLTSTSSDFAGIGDMLVKVNNVETQDLTPEKLVRLLSSKYPVLTMHKASAHEEEKKTPQSGSMRPYQMENTILNFSLSMESENCQDDEENIPQENEQPKSGSSDRKDDSFVFEKLLLVSMSNTSVAVMNGRGCDTATPCHSCSAKGCTFNEVVVATKRCEVTSVCKEYVKKQLERGEFLIQSLLQTTVCPKNIVHSGKKSVCKNNSTSANITIYYYKSNVLKDMGKGAAVVLNFSGSSNFLKCVNQDGQATLTVECCDKPKLQSIYKDDPATWPFVFYMTTTKDNCRRFESAAYSGWFISTKPSGEVCVDSRTDTNYRGVNFYIFIRCNAKS